MSEKLREKFAKTVRLDQRERLFREHRKQIM